jgi:UDP-glucose 4-epimerase
MTKTILVTGEAGYIRGVVTFQLFDLGYEIIVYDNLSNGTKASLPDKSRFVERNIADRRALEDLFGNNPIDAAVHFAAFIHALPHGYVEVNPKQQRPT